MKVKDITYLELNYWHDRIKYFSNKCHKPLTKQEYVNIAKELIAKQNVSERVALSILKGNFSEAIKLEEEENNG